jgi:Leucine-rich repeat (LRR) protein
MRSLFLLFLVICISFCSNAQIVSIPDVNFKDILLLSEPSNSIAKDLSGNNIAIDANNDGEIQVIEALEVFYLNVSNYNNISDLTGIQAFSNLIGLRCESNQLTNLDVTQNIALESLSCSNNQLI